MGGAGHGRTNRTVRDTHPSRCPLRASAVERGLPSIWFSLAISASPDQVKGRPWREVAPIRMG
jgi:hypothetical protein